MYTVAVKLMGMHINVRYQFHDNNYIEWRIMHDHAYTPEMELMDCIIRVHYTAFIEGALREHYHWKMEEEARGIDPNEPF
jgi:hypothetical protein